MLKRNRGFSLMELLITMTVSITLFAGVISLITQLLVSQRQITANLALENELSLVGQIMTDEIRRAGFNQHAIAMFSAKSSSPFTPPIALFSTEDEGVTNCILFSYDKNQNGMLDTETPDERFGFKLNNQAIEIRRDGAPCDKGGWHDLTDPRTVKVTAFILNKLTSPNAPNFLQINIKAHHAKFTQLQREKHLYVRLENG
ncbi:prepilin-type N-terminal cleavage/methylation domain-containing protein [Alteromonas sp. ASW11-130]|uniref:prepilin-type N-terminal cleavage/methylation domain-containing protein n=1 Tax=Alteromonas sp. ASW11-130 TaxID=3015775 RepID=UPI0022421AB7|nr:prepilin-type N-terminal cleavage/methylation domain-containing protein [Alteromonas sp. ASW11-130]MCW8092917.1 prepilin-type N-terminal cleavage/methylation domain-containing protein [Alteromonas sp. ASW11-130]